MNCLVIMPFKSEFDEVFASIRDATESAATGLSCKWLKEDLAAGKITDDIVNGLKAATFCIADLTGDNPNVMWETGFAMAIEKPTILIGQCIEKMPFDLKVHRMLEYDCARLDLLRSSLSKAVKHTIARLGPEQLQPLPAHLYWLGHDLARAIRFLMFEPLNRLELQGEFVAYPSAGDRERFKAEAAAQSVEHDL